MIYTQHSFHSPDDYRKQQQKQQKSPTPKRKKAIRQIMASIAPCREEYVQRDDTRFLFTVLVHCSPLCSFSDIRSRKYSSSMCLTDKILLQMHVTFCQYWVFHEFRRNLLLLNTSNKKVLQMFFFFEVHNTQSSQVLTQFQSCKIWYDVSDMVFIAACLANLCDISFQ